MVSTIAVDTVQLATGVQLFEMDTGTLGVTYMVRTQAGQQMQLAEPLYHLLRCMDKPRSLSDLCDRFHQQTGQTLSKDELQQVIDQVLRPKGLLAGEQQRAKSPNRPSVLAMYFRRDLIPARWLYPVTRVLGALFAMPVAIVPLLLVVVAHIITYAVLSLPPRLDAPKVPLIWVYILSIVSIFVHELGHLAACRRWQCEHGALGVGLYFFSPAFYVDVSPAWQLSRWGRVVVDAGGLYFQFLFTVVLCAAFLATEQKVFLWGIVINDISALRNLNPMLKLDGYWLFSDLVGIPNLHKRVGELIRYHIASLLHRLDVRKQRSVLSPFWEMQRSSKAFVYLYAVLSVLFWPLLLWLMAPALVQVLANYPALWRQSLYGLAQALRPLDVLALQRHLTRLLFPTLILANLAVIIVRLSASMKTFTRRILMNNKARWILIGGGVGAVVTLLAIGLIWFAIGPGMRGTSKPGDPGGIPVAQNAPDFTAIDLEGNNVKLSDFRGQPMMLKFWAPECPPCASEAIELQQVYEDQGGRIAIVTISSRTSMSNTQAFVSEHQITYPVLLDENGALMDQYQISGIPFTFLIDAKGVVQEKLVGTRNLDKLKQDLADFLAQVNKYDEIIGDVRCGSSECSP